MTTMRNGAPLLAVALLWASTAAAQSPQRHTEELEVGSAEQQLALDGTVLTYPQGAVFVPSRSRPELEPQVRVLLADAVVARGPTGRRLPLPAGQYRVVFGQGPIEWRASTTVTVEPGATTVADDFFGSLRVTAVGPDGAHLPVQYTLVSADGHRVYGPANTSETGEYDDTRTWILQPGSYRIVPGDSPTGRIGTVATLVSGDQRARVRLLVDESGNIVGSEPGDFEPIVTGGDWRFRWTIGGGGSLGQARRQLNGFSGEAARLELFTDVGVFFDRGGHLARFTLGVEQSWVGFTRPFGGDLPFQKLDDLLRAEVEYTYRLAAFVGPYVRATLRTALLPMTVRADRDYTIITTRPDDSERLTFLADGNETTLLRAFSPLILQEGAGLSFTLWETRVVRAGFSGGLATRQTLYRGQARFLTSHEDSVVQLQGLDDSIHWGPEANAWFRLHLGGLFAFRTSAEFFLATDSLLFDDEAFRPLFAAHGSLELRLSSWASLVYRITVHRDDEAIDELQYRQVATLRFHYSIF